MLDSCASGDGARCWYEVNGEVIECGGCYDLDACAQEAADALDACVSGTSCTVAETPRPAPGGLSALAFVAAVATFGGLAARLRRRAA
ncbi:MAG: hypothetical protein IPG04_24795 [Polyangiaceae bacterium]|nr:hypothetical protein [Polyangiaceae bacterium]